jgi:AraC-like DNA-binding protein
MASVLGYQDIVAILNQCRATGDMAGYHEGPEHFYELPRLLGRGYYRHIQLRPGLQLELFDVQIRHHYHHYIRQHPQPMPLTLSYYLLGGCQVENTGLPASQEEMAGKGYLYCLPNTAEVERYPAEQRIIRVQIKLSPELFWAYGYPKEKLPPDVRQVIEHPEQARLYYPSQISAAQRHLLQQILQWPYHGLTRHFYLEAKALDLLALHLNQMTGLSTTPALAASDIARVYQAREILTQNMSCPPSLASLAKQVQLNERKLKEGFRQVFNTTVFAYLQHYRMQQAQQLLIAGDTTVQEVAQWVGYASRSSFVAAFKKQFGVAPSHYRQSPPDLPATESAKGKSPLRRQEESV